VTVHDRVDDFLDKVVLPPQVGALDRAAAVVRLLTGATMVAVSISKFTRHGDLVASFEEYGIPHPERAVTLAGAVELVGGVLLLAGFMTRLTALFASLQFAVALGTGGRHEMDLFHLGLGTALLVACLYLVWAGAGPASADGWIYARRREWA
jgi:putative oxidoreductase